MRTFNKTPIALGVAAGMVMFAASTGAIASSAGTDFNLSAHAAAGGMAGAAYTRPQEASAAVFGNPATLSQFPGVNFNFGTSLIILEEVSFESTVTSVATGGPNSYKSTSDADNYIVPTLGISLQVSPNLTLGLGLEADSGLGADYRDDPISLAGIEGVLTVPLDIEVLSFNANLAAAYKMSEKLSLGASITIGFGLGQLGTVGPTNTGPTLAALSGGLIGDGGTLAPGSGPNANGLFSSFGGTTASVHDIGFGASLGATYEIQNGITSSLTVKSPVQYNFNRISYNALKEKFEDLRFEQPLEVIAGVAFDDVFADGLLVEADVVWKNWENAQPYSDIWSDQFLILLGTQYTTGPWNLRAGYQWTQSNRKATPGNSLGSLDAIGSLPLGDDASVRGLNAVASDIMAIAVQGALAPTIWEHTVTAGIGYNFTDAVRVDAFASYAFSEEQTINPRNLDATLQALGVVGYQSSYESQIDAEIMVGIGINVALP